MQGLIFTGTGTDIGKTYVLCQLLRAAQGLYPLKAIKPIVSGFDFNNWVNSDPGLILAAQDLALTTKNLEQISPWCFEAALGPDLAAALINTQIIFSELEKFCAQHLVIAQQEKSFLLIEGVGGLMSPLTPHSTIIDLSQRLNLGVILVGGTYLGAITHLLTAIEVLKYKKIPLYAVILNESAGSSVSLAQTALSLSSHLDSSYKRIIFSLKRGAGVRELLPLLEYLRELQDQML
jgi:dethiobiotin synthetase